MAITKEGKNWYYVPRLPLKADPAKAEATVECLLFVVTPLRRAKKSLFPAAKKAGWQVRKRHSVRGYAHARPSRV